MVSQLFLSSPVKVDPDRAVRFSLAGALSVMPVWFAWSKFFQNPIVDARSMVNRIAIEAVVLGPLYLSSLLFWSGTLRSGNIVDGLRTVKQSAFALYMDALKVVPAYYAFTYFAIAPHMRGYALTAFQFIWNIYVSWFVNEASSQGRPSPPPTSGSFLEIMSDTELVPAPM